SAPQPLGSSFWACRTMDLPSATPPSCPADTPLDLHVRFPECWDGANLDSANHKSHMAYGSRAGCPADHPVLLPKLALIVHYPFSGDPAGLSLASGGVYSGHADFFNAWDQSFLAQKVQDCLAEMVKCGPLQARGIRRLLGF